MKTGVTLEELNRLFDFLKQSKVNGEMTVLITNDMCKSLYDLMENCVKYQEQLQQENEQLKKSIKLFTDDLANMTNRALQLEKQKMMLLS